MRHRGVVRCTRCGIQVPGNAQLLPAVQELTMIEPGDFSWCLTFLLCLNCDRGAVLVRAGDHQYLVPLEAMVAGEDICREIAPGDMAQVQRPIDVGPADPDEYSLTHNLFRHGH